MRSVPTANASSKISGQGAPAGTPRRLTGRTLLSPQDREASLPAGLSQAWSAVPDQPVSIERWERFFALALDMLCIANAQGYFLTLNPAWGRCLGWSNEDLTSQPFVAFVHPDDVTKTVAETQKLLTGVETVNFENRYRCKDGSYRWLAWTSAFSPDDNLIYAVARDITATKQREVDLRDQTARSRLLQLVAEAANTANTVEEMLGQTLSAACEYTGWPVAHAYLRDDATGELVSAKVWHVDTPDGLVALKAASEALPFGKGGELQRGLLESRQPLWVADPSSDGSDGTDFLRAEGARDAGLRSWVAVPAIVGREVLGVIELFSREAGAPDARVLAMLSDAAVQVARVVERQRATQELRDTEERFRLIIETASDAFIAIDADSRILRWNRQAEATFGWLASEVVGRVITDTIIPEGQREAHRKGIRRFRDTGEGSILNKRIEVTACRKDGRELPIELTIWPVPMANTWRFNAFLRDVSGRRITEDLQRETTARLAATVAQLEAHDREASLLTEMGNLIITCRTAADAHEVIARFAGDLFPDLSGAVYVISASRNLMEAVSVWGPTVNDDQRIINLDACWALRRGVVHVVTEANRGLRCEHVTSVGAGGCLCVPMITQGEALGVLHINALKTGTAEEGEQAADAVAGQSLALRAAEHLALGLGNLRLRESLRIQSIRDPLTDLYNRRYLEETLGRELTRAGRNGNPVGIISFDIDHFKMLNDRFGHEAGDAVLRSLGPLIKRHFRSEDIACRYGGEEFTVVLPDSPLERTANRAESLRSAVEALRTPFPTGDLSVTVSIGVAEFPLHGESHTDVMRAADLALYAAKARGRNVVDVADQPTQRSRG